MNSLSPWSMLSNSDESKQVIDKVLQSKCCKQIVKSKNPSINGSFNEPVRKGRKPEVSKNHPAVIKCRELVLQNMPLHRVCIEVGVEYSMLARWYDKGWMDAPKKRRSSKES